MRCKRCGRVNPDGAPTCIYCGMPLRNSKKQTENVLVALIIVLLIVLAAVVGVFIYQSNSHGSKNFGGGGGGGTLPPQNLRTEIAPKTKSEPIEEKSEEEEEPTSEPTQKPTSKPKKTATPQPTEKPDDGRMNKKDEFLRQADEIEQYSGEYLETASSQYEINNESSVVYKKWDKLLNEIYQYLKTILSENEFENLQDEEMAWVKEKEQAIEEAGAEWYGGSGEAMVRNITGIEYTQERCYYLISLIN